MYHVTIKNDTTKEDSKFRLNCGISTLNGQSINNNLLAILSTYSQTVFVTCMKYKREQPA